MGSMGQTRPDQTRPEQSSVRMIVGIALSAAVIGAAGMVAPLSARASAPPTQAQVDAAILAGIHYLDTRQNLNGSFGTSFPVAETAMAVIAYGVADHGDVNSGILSSAEVTIVKNAVAWLLSQQDATPGQSFGSWSPSLLPNYSTGLTLSGLGFSKNAANATTLQTAIANGRAAEISMFQGPTHNPTETCSSTPPDPTASWCGGFNYDWGTSRSDESNTGFGLTGMKLTGGVPAALQSLDAGWQHNIQVLSTNPFFAASGRSDGGGSYVPGETFPPFVSNANDTGSMLFGYAYDGVPVSDPGVTAGLRFGQDVLDTYLKNPGLHLGVYHTGATEDGSCTIGAGCDWQTDTDGGYHYSLWSLSKGLAEYISPDLADPTNWNSKVATLLLADQQTNGSWPVDGRDDATPIVATGFSIFALGLAASPPSGVLGLSAGSYHASAQCTGAHLDWTNPGASNYGGLRILRRVGVAPTGPNDPQATLVANANAPATSFNDTGLTPGQTYIYGVFPYDTTGQLFGAEQTATVSTIVCADGIPVPNAGGASAVSLSADSLAVALVVLGGALVLLAAPRRRRRGHR